MVLLSSSAVLVFGQTESFLVMMDGKILCNGSKEKNADTVHLSKKALKKAKLFTIRFENKKEGIWKRATWLENENVKEVAKYTFEMPTPNGTILIPAADIRGVLKGQKSVEIYTSLKPKNSMMMVRETRELICKIVID